MLEGIPLTQTTGIVFVSVGGWVGLFYMVRLLFTGKLCTGRELAEKEARIFNLEKALENRDAQIASTLQIMPEVAEVLRKFHKAGEEVRQSRETKNV